MNATDADELAQRYPGFTCFKTSRPIWYRHRWYRDSLIQSALSADVISLSPSPAAAIQLPHPAEFAYREHSIDHSTTVVLTQAPSVFLSEVLGPGVKLIDRAQLCAEPRASAGRIIWSQKRLSVDPADRYRAIEVIAMRGGMAKLGDVISSMRSVRQDHINQALSLLANGVLCASLDHGIGPDTIITVGVMARGGRLSSSHRVGAPAEVLVSNFAIQSGPR